MNYLDSLNEKQREAVLHTEGPLCIVAGAGAGKTKTLTHRIMHLVKQGVVPHEILAITFTNKAAKEMAERVVKLIESESSINLPVGFTERPFVATFHRLGVFVLKHDGERLGIKKRFTIMDRDDAMRSIKKAIKNCGLDPKEHEPKKYLGIISKKKGDGITHLEHEANASGYYGDELVTQIWNEYERILAEENALDFDDLLLKPVVLFRKHADLREKYQGMWSHIHIDEYQDTNKVQDEIAETLAEKHRNICVVGDADQTIYGWRGAHIKHILQFGKKYQEAKTVLLEENYRSTKRIIAAANDIIKKNQFRHDKNLFTSRGEGEKITVADFMTARDEAHFVAETCSNLIREGVEPKHIAVLYRANFQSRSLEEAFLNLHVPHQVLGTRFFDRREVKDILSFIRAARNRDAVADMERVINVPPRGIGKVTLAKMVSKKEDELTASMRAKVDGFYNMLREIFEASEKLVPSELIRFVLSRTGLDVHLRKGDEEDQERLENIQELATLANRYDTMPVGEGIEQMIEDATLAGEQDSMDHRTDKKDENSVKLMTVHAAKGLEFGTVFVTGLEAELFPHKGFGEEGRDDEEERRLFYVAVTRAKEKLYLTYTHLRTIFGSETFREPSEFIGDLDPEYTEVMGDGGLGEDSGGTIEYLEF